MSSYVNALERFASDVLSCSERHLKKLEEVYSNLSAYCKFEIKDNCDIFDIIHDLYIHVSFCIADKIREFCKNEEIIDVVIDNAVKSYKIKGNLEEKLLKISKEIEDSKPSYSSFSDEFLFNSILDKTVEFDYNLEDNTRDLISYLIQNKLVEVGEEYEEEE